jgi:hypothetical protein
MLRNINIKAKSTLPKLGGEGWIILSKQGVCQNEVLLPKSFVILLFSLLLINNWNLRRKHCSISFNFIFANPQ